MPRIDQALRKTSARRARAPSGGGGGASRALLSQSDFSYLGYWDMPTDVGNSTCDNSHGLTYRYVSGNLRFYTTAPGGTGGSAITLHEFRTQGNADPIGSWASQGVVCVVTNSWVGSDLWGSTGYDGSGSRRGLWWEEANSRLWWSSVGDYPQGSYLQTSVNSLSARAINSNGTCSNFQGFYGLEGVGARSNYGGVRAVPTWFRSAYSVGPYLTGFGGYSSLYNQGVDGEGRPTAACLGPFLAILDNDPIASYTGNADYYDDTPNVPEEDFVIAADCRTGNTPTDWTGGSYASRTKDRGIRVTTNVTNHFDTSPGDLTAPETNWATPISGDPDGWGRWSWNDTPHGCFEIIDNDAGTQAKHGWLMCVNLATGHAWYEASNRHCDGSTQELHVYDPAQIALVIQGSLSPWKLRPTHAWELSLGGGAAGNGSGDDARGASGMCYDPTGGRLYLYEATYENGARLHAYSVNVGV